nr:DUF1801 domain-containing protein [Cohnella sp. AR92]
MNCSKKERSDESGSDRPSKAALSFMIFNAAELEAPEGLFEAGPPDRKTIKFKNGQTLDEVLLLRLIRQASETL